MKEARHSLGPVAPEWPGERYLRLKFGLPSYKGESDREHTALLKAVRQRDVARAQSLVTKHLLDTGELLHRVLCQNAEAVVSPPKMPHR